MLSLASACPPCVPASLSQHPWVTCSPLAQSAVALPTSWVQVVSWKTVSQLILHLGVPCVPGCNIPLCYRSEDGGLTSKFGTTSKCGTPCRADVPWQDRCTDGCGAAQLLGAGGALADHVPSDLTLEFYLRML